MMTPRTYPIDGNFEDVLRDAVHDCCEVGRRQYGGFDLTLPENAGLKRLVGELESKGYRPFIEYDPIFGNVIFITVMIKGGGSVKYSISYDLRSDPEMANYLIDRVTSKLSPPEAK